MPSLIPPRLPALRLRPPRLISPLSALLLAACAAAGPPPAADAPAAPGGVWVVSDAFPAGPLPWAVTSPSGQRLRLDPEAAGDLDGGLCPIPPAYRHETAPLGTVLGAATVEGPLAAPVPVLVVGCGDRPPTRFAVQAAGSLLARHRGWVVRLEPLAHLAALPDPLPEAPAEPLAAAAVAVAPPRALPVAAPPVGRRVYLASYRSEPAARRGWASVQARWPEALAGLAPLTRSVDVPGRGRFVRLFTTVADARAEQRLCATLRAAADECGISGRD